ncbi:MAG: hypothetical protein M1819_004333 [Sarea resinae]|nr:MAG: hypothetical protein M1819_004333 [Sarea resinae]
MSTADKPPRPLNPPYQFPPHNAPRVWFLTSGSSPIGIALSRQVLDHGDYVISGVLPSEFERDDLDRSRDFRAFLNEVGQKGKEGWRGRLRVVGLDSVVGTVEELSTSSLAMTLVRDQFETNFFGPVNAIKAVLPSFRAKKSGHIIILTGITGHIGTPGLGMYCASGWALEGFCDSLAYEIAPFNIKTSILQPNMEINILTNKISLPTQLPQYSPSVNPAPLAREILSGVLGRLSPPPSSTNHDDHTSTNTSYNNNITPSSPSPTTLNSSSKDPRSPAQHQAPTPYPQNPAPQNPTIRTLFPPLSATVQHSLVSETVHALTAIGGHDNPPARHIVGHDAVACVKEKLKTVSEELEDFVECSGGVDIVCDIGVGSGGAVKIEGEGSDGIGVGGGDGADGGGLGIGGEE